MSKSNIIYFLFLAYVVLNVYIWIKFKIDNMISKMINQKFWLEDRMTSLRSVSVAVLLYSAGYFVKLTVFINGMLLPTITNEYVRLLAAILTGYAFSKGLLSIATSNHKQKYIAELIAVLDGIILLFVFDVFNKMTLVSGIKVFVFCFFQSFIGYQLISTFVKKYQERMLLSNRNLSELERHISKKYDELKELKKTTCKKCDRVFNSINGLNAHLRTCKADGSENTEARTHW